VTLLALWFMLTAQVRGQDWLDAKLPPSLPPRCRSQHELDQLEALKLYGIGVLCERNQRLQDAEEAFEGALKLDPNAPAPRKALIALYLVFERDADALAACRKTLELDPTDYETWYLYSRSLKIVGQMPEAETSLVRALACPTIKENGEMFGQISFDLARMYEDDQRYEQAMTILQDLIKILESDQSEARPVEVYECLGRICSRTRRYDRAIEALRTARALQQPQDLLALSRLDYQIARIYDAWGKPAEALQYLDAYLVTQPPSPEPYELKVRLLKLLGRSGDVLVSIQEAADRDAHNVALKLFLARLYEQEGGHDKAEAIYLNLLAELPSAEVYRGLFALYKSKGRMSEALTFLDQAIAAGTESPNHPGDSAARTRARAMITALRDDPETAQALLPAARSRLQHGPKLEVDTRRFLAVTAIRSRQLGDAEDLYRSCLSEALPPAIRAVVYDGLLRVLWSAKKHDDVVALCRKGLANAGAAERLLLHTNLARALVVMGKADEALAETEQAVQLSDGENQLHCRLLRVHILEMADRLDRAEAEALALLKEFTTPDDARHIRYALSSIYSAARDYPKSEEQLRLILKEDPGDAGACNDLGYIMADQGKNLAEAEKLIRKALELDQEQKAAARGMDSEDDRPNAAYIDSLGWVLFRRGKLAEAEKQMELAASLPAGAADPVVWDHLGDVYFRLGKTARARSAWHKARELFEADKQRQRNDQYKELRHKLQQLESELQEGGGQCQGIPTGPRSSTRRGPSTPSAASCLASSAERSSLPRAMAAATRK
jgi:tetratricopeptide (TPR) repeat protein